MRTTSRNASKILKTTLDLCNSLLWKLQFYLLEALETCVNGSWLPLKSGELDRDCNQNSDSVGLRVNKKRLLTRWQRKVDVVTTPWAICEPALPSAARFSLIVYSRQRRPFYADSAPTVWSELLSIDKLRWIELVWDLCKPQPRKGWTWCLRTPSETRWLLTHTGFKCDFISRTQIVKQQLKSAYLCAKKLRASHRCLDVPCSTQHSAAPWRSSENNSRKMSEIPFSTRILSQSFKDMTQNLG